MALEASRRPYPFRLSRHTKPVTSHDAVSISGIEVVIFLETGRRHQEPCDHSQGYLDTSYSRPSDGISDADDALRPHTLSLPP